MCKVVTCTGTEGRHCIPIFTDKRMCNFRVQTTVRLKKRNLTDFTFSVAMPSRTVDYEEIMAVMCECASNSDIEV